MAYGPALNLESRISDQNPPCDLCGATESDLVLTTPRLDGPLVRCRDCGLFYVVFPENGDVGQTLACPTSPVASEMARLAERARELDVISAEAAAMEAAWRRGGGWMISNALLRWGGFWRSAVRPANCSPRRVRHSRR